MQSKLALIEFKGTTKSIYIPFVRGYGRLLIRFIWKFWGFGVARSVEIHGNLVLPTKRQELYIFFFHDDELNDFYVIGTVTVIYTIDREQSNCLWSDFSKQSVLHD